MGWLKNQIPRSASDVFAGGNLARWADRQGIVNSGKPKVTGRAPDVSPQAMTALYQLYPLPEGIGMDNLSQRRFEAAGLNQAAAASAAARERTTGMVESLNNALPILSALEALRARTQSASNNINVTREDTARALGFFSGF